MRRAENLNVSPTPDDLPAKYHLSFYLGEIVRNDTWAENEMKMLWRRLDEAGLGDDSTMQHDFARVIQQVRRMLGRDGIPAEFRAITLAVLDATHSAHQKRRELVHQILIQPPWANGRVREALGDRRTFSMDEIAACAEDLRTCMWRLRGAWIIAPAWVGGADADFEHEDPADLASWTRVAMGHIAGDPRQVVGTPGLAPEPPGGYASAAKR